MTKKTDKRTDIATGVAAGIGFVEASMIGQTLALQALQDEMMGLTQLIPGQMTLGQGGKATHHPPTAGEELAHEAEVEDGFDNMPV